MKQLIPSRRHSGVNESGSAYVIALFVILLLSMLGLSLSLVTATDVIIGNNDRLIQQTFYAADAGINVGAARVLVENGCEQMTYILNRDLTGETPTTRVQTEVTQASFLLLEAPCNYCEVEPPDEGGGNHAKRLNVLIVSQGRVGTRRARLADPADVIAARTVSAIIDVQPKDANIDCLLHLWDTEDDDTGTEDNPNLGIEM